MQLSNTIINIITTIFYILIFNYYLKNTYTTKNKNKIFKYLLQFILIYFFVNNLIDSFIKLILSIIIIIILNIVSFFYYDIEYKDILNDTLFIFIFILSIISIAVLLFEIIFEIKYTSFFISIIEFPKFFLNAISLYLLYVVISIYIKYKNPQFYFNIKIFKIISLFISVLYTCFILLNVKEIFIFPRIYKTLIFTFIIYNISLIIFNRYQSIHNQIENKLSLEKQKAEDRNKYLNKLLQADEDIKKLRHDLANTYTILQGYLNANKYDQAKAFVDKHAIKIEKASSLIHTGYTSVDSILEEKLQKMRRKNIDYHEQISNLYLGDIDESELAMVIALALDNAIEAAEKVDDSKEIKLSIGNHINFLIVEISNSIMSGSRPYFNKTSKIGEKHLHGYGVKGIKEYIEQYQGDMFYNVQYNKVTLKITLNTD